MDVAVDGYNENNGPGNDDGDAGGADDDNDDVGCCLLPSPLGLWALVVWLRRWTE